ncbi:MAG: hypothetical protein DMD57_04760 [Gemmatimonadetes bacterium]|nr:MAG: hypothetical protein DMD27_10680 [Gemmatimonadota bacterium]PYP05109.1 MAG: hypothetical protein DMD57_04760 [Gemmatimonadota bacterium]PYP12558.1 MAG: hypothetical protein DMD56_03695 [Gemmatimonadota bacterium]
MTPPAGGRPGRRARPRVGDARPAPARARQRAAPAWSSGGAPRRAGFPSLAWSPTVGGTADGRGRRPRPRPNWTGP